MTNSKDNYVLNSENAIFKVSIKSVIGDREDQQDSAGMEIKDNEGMVVICDGMGGFEGGKLASTTAVETILKGYSEEYPCTEPGLFLMGMAMEADKEVAGLQNDNGEPLRAGSTLVGIIIRNSELHWVSVGDSHIYLFRKGEFIQVTNDHILATLLNQQLAEEKITKEEYAEKIKQGEALVSFLGINGLPLIDTNEKAFKLESGDKIVLASDGLYKVVAEEEIRKILDNFSNIEEALTALDMKAKKNGREISRDNMTVAIIKIK